MMMQTIKLRINVLMYVAVPDYLLEIGKIYMSYNFPDFRAGGQMYRLQDSHRHEDGQRNSGHPAGLR